MFLLCLVFPPAPLYSWRGSRGMKVRVRFLHFENGGWVAHDRGWVWGRMGMVNEKYVLFPLSS